MKFFIFALFILAIVLFIKNWLRQKQIQQSQLPQNKQPEPMVACEYCQAYLPISKAYIHQHKNWCCVEHAQKGSS